jgi:hypothetical protein
MIRSPLDGLRSPFGGVFGVAAGGGGGAIPAPFQSVNATAWDVTYASPVVASPEPFTVSRQGYVGETPSTITETLYCTTRVRLPHPSQATLSTDRVALSDYIYSTDTIASVTNNSALTSPKPVANWALTDRRVVGDTLVTEVVAFHRNARAREQVAAVKFIATDGTATVSQIVTTSVISGRAGDQLPVIVYRSSLDISTLANPATITVNAEVYPHIGGSASVLKSADSSVAREFSPRFFRRDTTLAAAPVYAYVAATGGDDVNGAVSTNAATAEATPCATISGAINRLVAVNGRVDGCIIRCLAGSHVLSTGAIVATRTQDYSRLEITRDPNATIAAVTVTMGAAATRLRLGAAGGWLCLREVTFSRTGSNQPTGETGSPLFLTFEDCPFNNGSVNFALYGSNCDGGFIGCAFSGLAANLLQPGTREIRMLRGCTGTPSNTVEGWIVLGCRWTDMVGAFQYGVRTPNGSIFAFNRLTGVSTTNGAINIGATAAVSGVAIVQNVFEYRSATNQPSIRVSADSATGNNTHIIIHHNTFTGFFLQGRANIFYDEGPTARTSTLMSVRGNIHSQINVKGDVFAADGTRVGNWAYLYGVGCDGEFSQFLDADNGGIGSAFAQAYPGANASIGTSASVRNDPLFVAYAGTTSGPAGGAGGGNYALQSGSPAKNRAQAVLRFDAAGVERALVTSSGAYE